MTLGKNPRRLKSLTKESAQVEAVNEEPAQVEAVNEEFDEEAEARRLAEYEERVAAEYEAYLAAKESAQVEAVDEEPALQTLGDILSSADYITSSAQAAGNEYEVVRKTPEKVRSAFNAMTPEERLKLTFEEMLAAVTPTEREGIKALLKPENEAHIKKAYENQHPYAPLDYLRKVAETYEGASLFELMTPAERARLTFEEMLEAISDHDRAEMEKLMPDAWMRKKCREIYEKNHPGSPLRYFTETLKNFQTRKTQKAVAKSVERGMNIAKITTGEAKKGTKLVDKKGRIVGRVNEKGRLEMRREYIKARGGGCPILDVDDVGVIIEGATGKAGTLVITPDGTVLGTLNGAGQCAKFKN